MTTQRIPLDVLGRLVEKSRPRPPAVVQRVPPPAADDFAEEESPSVLIGIAQDGSVQVERLQPTQRTLVSELLAASTRVAIR